MCVCVCVRLQQRIRCLLTRAQDGARNQEKMRRERIKESRGRGNTLSRISSPIRQQTERESRVLDERKKEGGKRIRGGGIDAASAAGGHQQESIRRSSRFGKRREEQQSLCEEEELV